MTARSRLSQKGEGDHRGQRLHLPVHSLLTARMGRGLQTCGRPEPITPQGRAPVPSPGQWPSRQCHPGPGGGGPPTEMGLSTADLRQTEGKGRYQAQMCTSQPGVTSSRKASSTRFLLSPVTTISEGLGVSLVVLPAENLPPSSTVPASHTLGDTHSFWRFP